MKNLYPTYGLGEVDLLADPTITAPDGSQWYPEPGFEPFDATLAADETKRDLAQFFGRDCHFLWTGLAGTSTGLYSVQFVLPSGRLLSTAPVQSVNMIGTAQFPVPIWPPSKVPAGGKVGINLLTDLTSAENTVQILFAGVRLYSVRGPQQ